VDNAHIPRVLFDTNVWRELIDADAVELVRMAAKRVGLPVLVAPWVAYEATGHEIEPNVACRFEQ
jgi:hypothetical protein